MVYPAERVRVMASDRRTGARAVVQEEAVLCEGDIGTVLGCWREGDTDSCVRVYCKDGQP